MNGNGDNAEPLHLLDGPLSENNSQDDTFAAANNEQIKEENAVIQKVP